MQIVVFFENFDHSDEKQIVHFLIYFCFLTKEGYVHLFQDESRLLYVCIFAVFVQTERIDFVIGVNDLNHYYLLKIIKDVGSEMAKANSKFIKNKNK